jgi:dephospho-CoA kinase
LANLTKYIVGLTGGIGSGKSTAAKIFSGLNIVVVDADQLAREVVEPGSQALTTIKKHFGKAILLPDNSLDRSQLRDIVFADAKQRHWLEELLHPRIRKLLTERIQSAESAYVILESPLLLETNQKEIVDRTLVIDVSNTTQLERTMNRDGGQEDTIAAIIAAQIPRNKRLAAADDVLDNEQPLEIIEKQIEILHQKYLDLASAQ